MVACFGGPGLAKSSLLAEAWRAQAQPRAWVDLEDQAGLEGLQLALHRSLQRALPGLPLLSGGESSTSPRQWAALLAAEVEARAPEGLALVMDHLPTDLDAEAQAALKALVSSWPGWLGLAGRQAPEGLGLASLEAKGQARCVPAQALWLSADEEAAFWAEAQRGADPGALRKHTQGWPLAVALQAAMGEGQGPLQAHLAESWWPQQSPDLAMALRLGAMGPYLKPELLAQLLGPGPEKALQAALAQGRVPATPLEGGLWALPEALKAFLQSLPAPKREARIALGLAWQEAEPALAMKLLVEADAHQEASEVLRLQGAKALAEGRLEEVQAWLEASPAAWRGEQGVFLALEGEWLRRKGRPAEAQAAFQALLHQAKASPWAKGRARLGLAALEGAAGGNRFVAMATEAWSAMGDGDRLGQAEGANLRAAAALYAGQPMLAAAAFEGAAQLALEARAPALAAKATQNQGLALLAQGRVGLAIQAYRAAIAMAQGAGLSAPPMARANLAWAMGLGGAWVEGAKEAQAAAASAAELGQPRALAYARWAEGKLLLLQGQAEGALWAFEAALAAGRGAGDRAVQVDALAGLALLKLSLEDRGQGAWGLVLQAEALAGATWHHPGAYELARPAALSLALQGKGVEAQEGLRSLLGHPQLNAPGKRAQALALLAELSEGPEAQEAQSLAWAIASAHRLDGLAPFLKPSGLVFPTGPKEKPRSTSPAQWPDPAKPRTHPEDPPPASQPLPKGPQSLKLSLLGPIKVRLGDRPLAHAKWANSRGPALLAYLALHPDGATREALEEAFLGGEGSARSGVATMIQRLRLALEPELDQAAASRFVLLEDGRYRLAGPPWVSSDLAECQAALQAAEASLREHGPTAASSLEAWQQALGHQRGQLAEGLEGPWLEPQREAWRRQLARAHQQLILGLMDCDRGPEAVGAAEAFCRLDPLNEEALLRLVEALDAEGRRPEALQALQQHAQAWATAMPGIPLPPEAASLLARWGQQA